jgi:hypothetical protein
VVPLTLVKSRHRHRPSPADDMSTSAVTAAKYVDAPYYVVVMTRIGNTVLEFIETIRTLGCIMCYQSKKKTKSSMCGGDRTMSLRTEQSEQVWLPPGVITWPTRCGSASTRGQMPPPPQICQDICKTHRAQKAREVRAEKREEFGPQKREKCGLKERTRWPGRN